MPREVMGVVRGDASKPGEPAKTKLTRVVERINAEYALVVVGNTYVVMQELPADSDIGPFRFLSLDTFREKFRPKQIRRGNETVSYAAAWLSDTRRRAYEGIVFAPKREVPGYYNL